MLNPFDIVIFGGGGDLALRKLLPAMYRAYQEGNLPQGSRILPTVREESKRKEYIETAHKALQDFLGKGEYNAKDWKAFSAYLVPVVTNVTEADDDWDKLKDILDEHDADKSRVFYLSLPPAVYGSCCEILSKKGLITETSRVVVEKPIGYCGESAEAINAKIAEYFKEEQVFRIDHYLGKETVLNLVSLRFANSIFATNWDHNCIDHVQISVAESVGIEGRWGYFDDAGQMRDMVQNHLLQILSLVAMEPPTTLDADSIRDEKLKVLKALRPINSFNINDSTVRGQYTSGFVKGEEVPGYLEEEGANTQSKTETFVAIKAEIDNWRWAGVPFYLRTGKRMPTKVSEVVIYFKRQPHNLFGDSFKNLPPNKLVIRLQPDEGVEITVMNKVPGLTSSGSMDLQKSKLNLSFSEAFADERIPDAYEKLLLEVMLGNQALFVRRDEIEQAWTWVDSILEAWKQSSEPPEPYQAGTWGPVDSIGLLARENRSWYESKTGKKK